MKRITALILLTLAARADVDIVLYSQTESTGGTTTNIVSGVVTNGSLVDANGYCRPSDWLPLPELSPTEQKVNFLYAIFPPAAGFDAYGGNYLGLRCTTTAGNYIVDWGNGTVTTNATNTTASNGWDYASIPTNTLCSRGYKQVVVSIVPQTAGVTFTGTFDARGYRTAQYALSSSGILDINIEGGFTTLYLCGSSLATVQVASHLERIKSASCAWSSGASMFLNAYSLQSVDINTRSMSSGASMFSGCSALQNITFNSTTNMSGSAASMFFNCFALKTIANLNASRMTSLSQFAYSAYVLQSFSPVLDTSAAGNCGNIFTSAYSLSDLGTLNLSACTTLASAFSSMFSLQNVRLTNMRTNILAISFANSGLSREALTNIFTDLPDRTGTGLSQAITVTGARGAAALTAADKAIATNKLWSVIN